MASKKELQAQLDKAQARVAETREREQELAAQLTRVKAERDVLSVDNKARKRREAERTRHDHHVEQQRLREAEHAARRERLDQLGAGLLPIKGATSYAFIHERDGENGLEVFVPLDAEERRIVEGFFDARNQPRVTSGAIDGSLLNSGGLLDRIVSITNRNARDAFVFGGVPV